MKTEQHEMPAGNCVIVDDEEAVIVDLHVDDRAVVSLLKEADDPAQAARQLLALGANAARMIRPALDVEFVDTAFERLLSQLEALLASTFDEDSRSSAIGRFKEVTDQMKDGLREGLIELLDPEDGGTPLGRHLKDTLDVVRGEGKRQLDAVRELSERIAVQAAEKRMAEKASEKGLRYQEIVHAAVAELVAPYGDVAEFTANTAGDTGGDVGDVTVLLDPEGTHGASPRYVVEAKDRRETLPRILSELDEAMLNRGASAAVAVFGKPSASPVPVSFQRYGNKAIVVFDKETLDESALHVAVLWARWLALRSVEDQQSLDTTAVAEVIDRLAQALDRVATIRRNHTLAKKNIEDAGRFVDLLQQEVSRGLEELRQLICDADGIR